MSLVVKVVLAIILLVSCIVSVPSWVWDTDTAIAQSKKLNNEDWDIPLIIKGVSETATFAETAKWWHGTWAGQVPFWRPVTSIMFWVEYEAFGPERYDLWMGVSVALQVIVCGLIIVFFSQLTGNQWLGWGTAMYFVAWRITIPIGLSGLLTTAPATIASHHWKDQPEMLVSIFILLTLIFAVSKKWGWLIVAAALAVCVKESGWFAFPLAVIVIYWREGIAGLKSIPVKWWVALATVAVVLVAARASAGPDVFWGYKLGSNDAWALRLTNALGSFVMNNLTMPLNGGGVVLGIGLWLAILRRARPSAKAGWIALAVVIATVVQMVATRSGVDVAVVLLVTNWHVALCTMIYLLPIAAIIHDRASWKLATLLLIMLVAATLPCMMAAQVQRHALYVMYIFQSGLVALALQSLVLQAVSTCNLHRRPSS